MVAAACVVVPFATSGVAAADSTAAPVSALGAPGSVVSTHTVTLVTGEVVTLQRQAGGVQTAIVDAGSDGTFPSFSTITVGEDLYVIPEKAQPYLAANQLDRDLFNVTQLVADGYDDARSANMPLIATYAAPKGRSANPATKPAPEGSVKHVELPSVNAAGLHEDKSEAATFWEAVDDDTLAPNTAPTLADGIQKIWLDEPVKASLDQSVPQIGAPEAWAKGFDGKGVKVAVLDTGLDPTHPDLVGRVKATENFTGDPDAVDHHGHGTHVASTIAGSGAASGGKYKGVAPEADLYIGKVLDNVGNGPESGVMAGMEWAVAQGADVVSMSLGTEAGSDGSDPLSQAVNRLSASSGALFVIAAGNTGPAKGTVGSPGAADAALTVGAVSKQDVLASFSSRGPLKDTFKVKPEITAPGVAIVAARAAGTAMGTPVDANYTSASGTSMATPHVAGAAAILAQEHPDWTGDRLKQVLANTAKPGSYTAYQQGVGRVDVPKALAATVYSSPAVISMGKSTFDSAPITKTITYVNTSAEDKTLSLSLFTVGDTGGAPQKGTLTLSADSVTVPANSSATVTTTFNPPLAPIGDFTGIITATAPDGSTIKTSVGATKDVPTVTLTVNWVDRHGNPAHGEAAVFDLDQGSFKQIFPTNGTTTVALPLGRYSVMGLVHTADLVAPNQTTDYTLAGQPVVDLTGAKTITLDARAAKEVKIATPDKSEPTNFKIGYKQQLPGRVGFDFLKTAASPLWDHVYVVPTGPVTEGTFDWAFQQRRFTPAITASYAAGNAPLPLEPVTYALQLHGPANLLAVAAGQGRPEDLTGKDLAGKLAVVTRSSALLVRDQVANVAKAGAKAVIIVNDRPGPYATIVPRVTGTTIPAWSLTQDQGATLLARIAKGDTLLNLQGVTNHPAVYNISLVAPGAIPDDPTDAVTPTNSALVEGHYRGAEGQLFGDWDAALRPGDFFVVAVPDFFEGPGTRTEWHSTGSRWPMLEQIQWWHAVYPDRVLYSLRSMMDMGRSYQPGGKYEQTWFGAANGPSGPEGAGAVRKGDTLTLSIREMGDSEPGHFAQFEADGDTMTARVYRDGTLIASPARFNGTAVAASPDPATYRVTLDTEHLAWHPLSTRTSTAWTFRSARPTSGSEDLALLWPRFGFTLDEHNAAVAGAIYDFDLSFLLQNETAPKMSAVKVETSIDDGATWKTATIKAKTGGHYDVVVANPKTGYVSLKVSASDADGSKVEQTLTRAYAVR